MKYVPLVIIILFCSSCIEVDDSDDSDDEGRSYPLYYEVKGQGIAQISFRAYYDEEQLQNPPSSLWGSGIDLWSGDTCMLSAGMYATENDTLQVSIYERIGNDSLKVLKQGFITGSPGTLVTVRIDHVLPFN